MDIRTQELKKKGSSFLRSAKNTALRVKADGSQKSSKLVELVTSTAQKLKNQASSGSLPGSPSRSSGSRVPAGANAALSSSDQKVERLCALGFSVAAVRHALSKCGGRVEHAGMWLLDEANADEVLAAEIAARDAAPLTIGASARIAGLRAAVHLNGMEVTLRRWDTEAQRWVVETPDGSLKSLRPRNLEPVGGAASSKEVPQDIADSLRKQVHELLGDQDAMADEWLRSLSIEELLDVVAGFVTEDPHIAGASPGPKSPATCPRSCESPDRSQTQPESPKAKGAAAEPPLASEEGASPSSELPEEVQQAHQPAGEGMENHQELGSCSSGAAIAAVDVQHQLRKRLEEQQAELEWLRAKAEAASKDFEHQQAAAQQRAEERELQLLEEEAEQMRIAASLREEQARLEQQRRSMLLLQQSLLGKNSLQARTDGVDGACVELTMDDGNCTIEEPPEEEGKALSSDRSRGGEGEAPREGHCESQQEQDDDLDDEVWDLDWSALGGGPRGPPSDPEPDIGEAAVISEATQEVEAEAGVEEHVVDDTELSAEVSDKRPSEPQKS